MSQNFVAKVRESFDRIPPRTRQWLLLGAGLTLGFLVLWAALSSGSDNGAAQRAAAAAAAKSDLKPTNVDIMAPGSPMKPEDSWVAGAGRDIERMKKQREEEQAENKKLKDETLALQKRFADLEERLTKSPAPAQQPSPPAPALQTNVPPPATAMPPAYPPAAAAGVRPAGLPPPPLARGATPIGPPGAGLSPLAEPATSSPPQPAIVKVTVSSSARPVDATVDGKASNTHSLDTFLPVSFTRGIILGGLDAPTGGQAQANPHPVLIQLSDNSVLPNRFRAEYRECFVVGAGWGDPSSQRALIRTESLSCVRKDGTALEVRIQGNVFGDDGKYGVRGRLVSKQGQMLWNALSAGIFSGLGQGLQASNTTYSTSALGSVASTSGSDAYRAGIGAGVGKALDRLAAYYIKRAEEMMPIIEVDAGLEIDVVITKGVRIDGSDSAKSSPTSLPTSNQAQERFMKVNDDE